MYSPGLIQLYLLKYPQTRRRNCTTMTNSTTNSIPADTQPPLIVLEIYDGTPISRQLLLLKDAPLQGMPGHEVIDITVLPCTSMF